MPCGFVLLKVLSLRSFLIIDDRIAWGCAIIGCPSYIELMEYRLQQSRDVLGPIPPSRFLGSAVNPTDLPQARLLELLAQPPYLPASFIQILQRDDPGTILRLTGQIPVPLKEKMILVLSGGDDPLVPWSASTKFVSLLQQQSVSIEVNVYDGVGHAFTPEMGKDFRNWFIRFL
jgi:acetyl esterase/lipase